MKVRRFQAGRAALAAGLLGMGGIGVAQAHGGLSMDKDICTLAVGRHRMHFAGYQEDAQRTEFCEDIPNTGRTTIVLDFIDDALRDMPVEVRIVRHSEASPASAPALFVRPTQRYPKGTVALGMRFDQPGDYVGVVIAGTSPHEQVSVFPFSVGASRLPLYSAAGAAGVAVLGAVMLFIAARRRLRLAVAAGGAGS